MWRRALVTLVLLSITVPSVSANTCEITELDGSYLMNAFGVDWYGVPFNAGGVFEFKVGRNYKAELYINRRAEPLRTVTTEGTYTIDQRCILKLDILGVLFSGSVETGYNAILLATVDDERFQAIGTLLRKDIRLSSENTRCNGDIVAGATYRMATIALTGEIPNSQEWTSAIGTFTFFPNGTARAKQDINVRGRGIFFDREPPYLYAVREDCMIVITSPGIETYTGHVFYGASFITVVDLSDRNQQFIGFAIRKSAQ